MADQIIATQGDSGIEVSPTFIDKNKNPVNITGCTVEISFIYPDGSISYRNGQVINGAGGIASTILSETNTAQTGLCSTYWKVIDDNSNITAQEEIYYYVREYLGGAV